MKRFTLFLTVCLLTIGIISNTGCKKLKPDEPVPGNDIPASEQNRMLLEQAQKIRSLSPDVLTALGPQNDLPVQWVAPNAYMVQYIQPQRLKQSPAADDIYRFMEALPKTVSLVSQLDDSDSIIISETLLFVPILNPATGDPLAEKFPLPFRTVMFHKNAPIDQQAFLDNIFSGNKNLQEMTVENLKITYVENKMEIPLDQEGKQTGRIDGVILGVVFPDDQTAIILNYPKNLLEEYCSLGDGDKRGVLAQRLARADYKNWDFLFLYDCDTDNTFTKLIFPQIASLPVPFPVTEQAATNISCFEMGINSSAGEEDDVIRITVRNKSETGAADVKKSLGSGLLQMNEELSKTTVSEQSPNTGQILENMKNLLKSLDMEIQKSDLVVSLKGTKEIFDALLSYVLTVNQYSKNTSIAYNYNEIEDKLFQLGQYMTEYNRRNGTYPPVAITDADGNPLLSWRVALLPAMGQDGDALYKQFKLDEPWNSDTNLALLDKMPAIYASPFDTVDTNKTTFQIFNSANVPFGQTPGQGIKIQNIPNPFQTFLVVSTRPEKAIEWTRPETLEFAPDRLTDVFDNVVAAITVMGQVIRAPFEGSPEQINSVQHYILGEAQEAPAQEAPAPEAQEAPAQETPAPEAQEAPAQETPAPEAQEVPAQEVPAPETQEALDTDGDDPAL